MKLLKITFAVMVIAVLSVSFTVYGAGLIDTGIATLYYGTGK